MKKEFLWPGFEPRTADLSQVWGNSAGPLPAGMPPALLRADHHRVGRFRRRHFSVDRSARLDVTTATKVARSCWVPVPVGGVCPDKKIPFRIFHPSCPARRHFRNIFGGGVELCRTPICLQQQAEKNIFQKCGLKIHLSINEKKCWTVITVIILSLNTF